MSKLIRRIFLTDLTKVPIIIKVNSFIKIIFCLTIYILFIYFILWILLQIFPSYLDEIVNLLIGKY